MNVFEIDRMLCVHYTFDQFRIQLMRIKKRTLFLYVESGVLYFFGNYGNCIQLHVYSR